MRRIFKTKLAATAATLLLFTLSFIFGTVTNGADEAANEALVQMIVELVSDADPDMRALGFQQVREEAPGEAATEKFAALLPELPVDGQAGLLAALGDRGDAAARPAVLKMVESDDAAVRAAALKALGALGDVADVPLLAEKVATAGGTEKTAARQSLVRLAGDQVNGAIVSAMDEGKPAIRAALLDVLALRNAKEALPHVFQCTKDSDATVRLAALDALRFLADESHTAKLVEILKGAEGEPERRAAELALLVVCSRGREACAEAIVAGLAEADVPSRVALLRALARAGGDMARKEMVARLEDPDQAVRDEALRMLSIWEDPAVAPQLMEIAESADDLRPRVLAIRGLVRLARPHQDQPADVQMLGQLLELADRPQETRLVLGALSRVAAPEALDLVTPVLEYRAVAEEAGLAAVLIAENLKEDDMDKAEAAMKKVLERTRNETIRERAQKVLQSL